ncbi:MAG TPA: polyprenol monophosphomannose synthase [Actinomycetospora sp.]|jgi:dolichol-phosphate mannosyltransferase|uniref:polyprenol monophosphomannose synthase n=1 Tax=Actinomycetospora sp. TaxID=1872135 RepID=UPI002F411E5B
MSGGTPAADGSGVLVVVPTYDERDNLPPLVARILASLPGARLLVVDDGSPDGTGEVAEELADRDPRVAVLHHRPKRGLGAAYVDAFAHVVKTHGAGEVGWVVQMDADGSHAPEDLPALLAGARTGGADLVLGSRYVPGGRVVDWPWHRNALSRAANLYSRLALRLPIRDVTGGFRLFRRAVLEEITRTPVSSQGYCFQVDLAFRVHRGGFVVREVPITFTERTAGASKMSGAVVREALWRITAWAVRDRLRTRRDPVTLRG